MLCIGLAGCLAADLCPLINREIEVVCVFLQKVLTITYEKGIISITFSLKEEIIMKCKKALKIVGIILGVAAVAAGVFFAVRRSRKRRL